MHQQTTHIDRMAPRKFFIGGNYKAAANVATVGKIVEVLNGMGDLPQNADVVVAPSAIHIGMVKQSLRSDVKIAVQDIHTAKGMGAYTGSHTADLVKDFGLEWALVGHSERRSIFGESDGDSAAKTKVALEAGISVVFCIGESLAEREAGKTLEVCFRLMKAVGDAVPPSGWEHIVVAYEPVWAIGTGKVATAAQAQEVHAALRQWLADNISADVSASTRIIYGGSVNGANAAGLIAEKDIDGFLVGGASLKPEFADVIKSVLTKAE